MREVYIDIMMASYPVTFLLCKWARHIDTKKRINLSFSYKMFFLFPFWNMVLAFIYLLVIKFIYLNDKK